jgi:hypothetical protein
MGEGLPFGIWPVDHQISRGSGAPKATGRPSNFFSAKGTARVINAPYAKLAAAFAGVLESGSNGGDFFEPSMLAGERAALTRRINLLRSAAVT